MEINDLQNTHVFPPEKPDLPTFPPGKREFLFAFALLILGAEFEFSAIKGMFREVAVGTSFRECNSEVC